jgi:hypothetical protein
MGQTLDQALRPRRTPHRPHDVLAGYVAQVLTGRADDVRQGAVRFPWRHNPAEEHAGTVEPAANRQVYRRNGIWVATSDGVWLGDYHKREHALAAVKAAGRDRRRTQSDGPASTGRS